VYQNRTVILVADEVPNISQPIARLLIESCSNVSENKTGICALATEVLI